MQALSKIHWLTLPAHHGLINYDASTSFRSASLLLQVEHTRLQFVPFYALFFGSLLAPAWPPKSNLPTIHHQNRQLAGPPLWLALLGWLLESLLRLCLGFAPKPLHQRVHHRVIDRTAPLGRH